MNNSNGYIRLHRKITGWEWYHDPNTFRVFLHILLNANYVDGHFEGKVIRRGQLVTSLPSLSRETGVTIRSVRTALEHLFSTGELTVNRHPRYSVITVVNYDLYQSDDSLTDSETTGNRQATDRQLTGKRQQYKKEKKEKDIYNSPSESVVTAKRFTPPTPEDVENFCREAGLEVIDGERFCDYYASKGWLVGKSPMKDWRATVRNWARRNASPEPEPVKRVIAQDFEQRDYSSVPDEEMQRMAERIARMKAEGRIGRG